MTVMEKYLVILCGPEGETNIVLDRPKEGDPKDIKVLGWITGENRKEAMEEAAKKYSCGPNQFFVLKNEKDCSEREINLVR